MAGCTLVASIVQKRHHFCNWLTDWLAGMAAVGSSPPSMGWLTGWLVGCMPQVWTGMKSAPRQIEIALEEGEDD